MGGPDPAAEVGTHFCDDLPVSRAAGEACGRFVGFPSFFDLSSCFFFSSFSAFSFISLSSTTRARASSESRIFSGIDLLARGSTSASCRAHAVSAGGALEGVFGRPRKRLEGALGRPNSLLSF
jgi:hypothetical protein